MSSSTTTTTTPKPAGYSNPVRLAVATNEAGPSNQGERERLLRAKKRNDEIRRKGEKWADKLMEETVEPEVFKRALRYIHPSQYDIITHERHLNSLCSYPLCPRAPAEPFRSGRRFRISTTNRSITEVEGNKEEGFCSRPCKVRSEWVRRKLDEAGSVLARGGSKEWTIELVEDLDLDLARVVHKQQEQPKAKPPARPKSPQKPKSIPISTPAAAPEVPPDLLAGLTIHERPTPRSAPPPSAAPVPALPTTPMASGPASKRAPSAMMGGEQSKLAQTVLKASKAINPEPQVNPDSEDEGEHAEVEWEREVGLSWGDGGAGADEEGDLWRAMREAQELVS